MEASSPHFSFFSSFHSLCYRIFFAVFYASFLLPFLFIFSCFNASLSSWQYSQLPAVSYPASLQSSNLVFISFYQRLI